MSHSTFKIVMTAILIMAVISLFFPYQRFNIGIKYATIIRIVLGAAVVVVSSAGYLLDLL